MSLGRLVVELELKDGQFYGRMKNAQKATEDLGSSFNKLDTRLKGIERSTSGAIPHLRDLAIISASLQSIFYGVNNTFGELARSFISANAEIEKSTKLLEGMSTAVDQKGRMKEAADDMKYLLDTAKSAPFSLKELSNSFVKLSSVGLDDVRGKLGSLTDAIANFGGDDQTLHRATVAIQQMASKGVISMEELRQQLGESVPTAMKAMASGLGVSMSYLVKNISEGKVKAVPAIEAMMRQFELSMAGSSQRMMNTWNGMVSQLSTTWMQYEKTIGDTGAFSKIKDQLQDLITALSSDEALSLGNSIGNGISEAVTGFREFINEVDKSKTQIIALTKLVAEFWVIAKVAGGVGNFFGGIGKGGGILGFWTELNRSVNSYNDNLKTAGRTFKSQITEIPANWGNHTTTEYNREVRTKNRDDKGRFAPGFSIANFNRTNTSYNTLSSADRFKAAFSSTKIVEEVVKSENAIKRFGSITASTLGLLAGPIGILVAGIATIGVAWWDAAGESERAIESLIKKQKELSGKKFKLDGEVALFSKSEIDDAKKNLEERAKLVASLQAQYNRLVSQGANFETPGYAKAVADSLKKAKDDQKEIEEAIKTSEAALVKRRLDLQRQEAKKEIEIVKSGLTTQYQMQIDHINKIADEKKAAKESEAEVNRYIAQSTRAVMLAQTQETIDALEKEKKAAQQVLEEVTKGPAGQASLQLIDKQKTLDDLIQLQSDLRTTIEVTKSIIESSDDPEQKGILEKALASDQEKLKEIEGKVEEFKRLIDNFKANSGITTDNIINAQGAVERIKAIQTELLKLLGLKDKYQRGDYEGDGAISSGTDSQKKLDKELDAAKNQAQQEVAKVAATAASYLKTFGKEYEKIAIKSNGEASQELIDAISKKAEEGLGKNRTADNQSLQYQALEAARTALNEYNNTKDSVSATKKNYDEITEVAAVAIDSLKELAKQEGIISQIQDERGAIESRRAIEQQRLDTGVRDFGDYVSEEQLASERELNELRKNGGEQFVIRAKEEELALLKLRDQEKGRVEDIKKTAQLSDEISRQNKERLEQADEFLSDFNLKTADEITMAAAYASDNVVEIKKAETDAIINEAIRAAKDQGVILDDQVNDFRAKEEAKVRILEDLASKRRSIEERYAHQRSMKDYAIGMIGNPRQRDFAAVEEEFRRRREDLDRDPQIPNSAQGNEEWAQKRINLELEYQAAIQQTKFDHRNSFERMTDDLMTYDQTVGEIQANFVDGFLDGLNEFVRTGEFSLSEFTTNMLLMMQQIIAKQLMLLAIEQMIGKTRRENSQIDVGGGADGGIMGWLGLAKSAVGAFGGFFGGGVDADIDGLINNSTLFANGGIAGKAASLSVAKYAKGGKGYKGAIGELLNMPMASKTEMQTGGVKKSAHMAIFAEAGVPEAFIPMTDGKNVPLSVSKDGSGNIVASALLPDGRSIPAKVVDGNISAFARGGVVNGEDPMEAMLFDPPTMSVLPDMESAMNNFIDAISEASMRIGGLVGGQVGVNATQSLTIPAAGKVSGDNIEMNFNIQDSKSSGDGGKGGGSDKTDNWNKVGERVKDIVISEIAMQKRPGGLLWENGK